MEFIDVSWAQIKEFSESRQQSLHFIEFASHYDIRCADSFFRLKLRLDKNPSDTTDLEDFELNYKGISNQPIIQNIRGRFEREDIRLLMAKAEAEFDENGEAEVTIKIPEVLATGGGRFIGGGFAFTNGFAFGDFCSKISVVDVDNVLGGGAHSIVATYHDPDVPTEPVNNQGWYLWPSHQGSGEIEVEPMGFYGFINSELYLELYFKKVAGSTATKVFVDFWWGKET